MWPIIQNEWHSLGRNRTLLGVSTVFVTVLLLSVVLGKQQADERTTRYRAAQNQLRQQWENLDPMHPHGAVHYGTYVFKPTTLLSGLDEGVSSVTGNVLRVEGHVQNELVHPETAQMQAASKFGKLNGSLLLQYLVPLLLLFLSFQRVSSEKQSGRLKLLVLQGAKPSTLIWAKTLSVWLYGMALLTITIGAFAFMHRAGLDVEIALRTLLLYGCYALYYFIISGLTVLLSARGQQATIA
ncbi:MAG: ABC transporter permease subunit, partial [Bacteroidota bacterium]